MTCITSSNVTAELSVPSVRGFCLRHAMQFAETAAKRWPPASEQDMKLRASQLVGPSDQVNPSDADEYVDLLAAQERCDDCPVFVGKELFEVKSRSPFMHKRLGKECRDDANRAARSKFPNALPHLSFGNYTREYEVALWVTNHARSLISDAWEEVVSSWPTCPGCPIPEVPKPKHDTKLRVAVLDVLSAHRGPMSTSDLVATVPGLNNNNARRQLGPMVEEGLVILRAKGSANFYSLPE